jgi:hypothetical protein
MLTLRLLEERIAFELQNDLRTRDMSVLAMPHKHGWVIQLETFDRVKLGEYILDRPEVDSQLLMIDMFSQFQDVIMDHLYEAWPACEESHGHPPVAVRDCDEIARWHCPRTGDPVRALGCVASLVAPDV